MKIYKRIMAFVLTFILLVPLCMETSFAESSVITDSVNVESTRTNDGGPVTVPTAGEPLVVAYFNSNFAGYAANEFTYVDVINYHPAMVNGNANGQTLGITCSNASYLPTFKARTRAQNPDIKILMTFVSNSGPDFELFLQTHALCDNLAGQMVAYVDTYDLDGLDIDYEFPSNLTLQSNFIYLLQSVRTRLNMLSTRTGKEYLLTIAVPATWWSFYLFDMNAAQQYVDYFNIMNYDTYPRNLTFHHTAPCGDFSSIGYTVGSVEECIKYYLDNGITRDKIVVGAGMYSREWLYVGNANNGLFQTGTLTPTNYHYTELVANYINKNGYIRYWDDYAKAPYLFNPTQHIFLSYDDYDSVRVKCDLIREFDIRGLMIFDYITCDGIGFFNSVHSWLYPAVHEWGPWAVTTPATCTSAGSMTRACTTCTLTETKVKPMLDHSWGAWVVTVEPTHETTGLKTNTCLTCGITKTEVIPILEGEPYTPPDDNQNAIPAVSNSGLNITIDNLEGVKDIFIAKGDFSTYRECKNAEFCVGISSTKINGAKSYTYLAPSVGLYTICVRYNDTARANDILKINIDVLMPEIITNGMQVCIGNTEGIKVIRTAPGIYQTTGEVKRADGNRNFTSSMIGGSDPYTIQYGTEGTYTISVEYTNGLVVIQTVEIIKKTPTYEVQGNTVTFGNLEGCKVFRYAPGVWMTSSEVKYAPDMKYIHATKIVQDNYVESVTLEPGTYTFLVQYDDLSVNIITVVIT